MGRIVLRIFLAFLFLAAAGIGWIAGGRSLSLLLDRIGTRTLESQEVTEFGGEDLDRGMLRIGNIPFNTSGPDLRPSALRLTLTAEKQLRAESNGRSITLGQRANSLGTIRPAPGESARFQIDRSLLSWPTPLEMNFMTGVSPSWKRHLYYRFIWRKHTGAHLEMVWRYEQWFYPGNGWASGFMTRAGTTGMIRAEITP